MKSKIKVEIRMLTMTMTIEYSRWGYVYERRKEIMHIDLFVHIYVA